MDKFYQHLTFEQKRKLRKLLDDVRQLRKEQLEVMEKAFIEPLKQQMYLIDKVKHNEISLKKYVEHSHKYAEWLEGIFVHLKGATEDKDEQHTTSD